MAWRAITDADILTRMSGDELETFRVSALATGQDDPVADVITQVTNEIRGYIAACEKNTLGSAGTIPETLLGTALDKLVIEIQSRVAGIVIDSDEVRRDKLARAQRLLRDVAQCNFTVEQPESGSESDEDWGGLSPASTTPTRRFNRASQDGV